MRSVSNSTSSTGQLVYGYSAYGETQALGVDGNIPNNSNQYTARENDGPVGGTSGGALYYYRARYYDPVLKRFISEDPIGLPGGLNVHAYVRGNPTKFVDPTGLLTECQQRYLRQYYGDFVADTLVPSFSLFSLVNENRDAYIDTTAKTAAVKGLAGC